MRKCVAFCRFTVPTFPDNRELPITVPSAAYLAPDTRLGDEAGRLAALGRYTRPIGTADPTFDAIANMVCTICEVPSAAIALIDSPMLVTVAINRVEFKQPVLVGDVVRFETAVERLGRTSITMRINVVAERAGTEIHVTESEVVYVGVGEDRQPVPLLPARPAAG